MSNEIPGVRIASYGGHEGRVVIEGLTKDEIDLVCGAMTGGQWVRCVNGRIEHSPAYEAPPSPTEDKVIASHWPQASAGAKSELQLIGFDKISGHSSPSIIIQHLCGYNFTPENYVAEARNLEQWGFVCLRSRRSLSNEICEIWHLPGLYAAKNELKTAIEELNIFASLSSVVSEEWLRTSGSKKQKKIKQPEDLAEREKKRLEIAISFLCRFASFGTLDVTVQRAAMTID